jgi:hypothetical protein
VAGDHELRAVGVVGLGPLVQWPDGLGPGVGANSPESLTEVTLPARVTQAWIERTAPRLVPTAVEPFLHALSERGWNDAEIDARVRPHLPNRR